MKNVRLNDLQLVLLSAASNREDGSLLPAPASVAADPKRVQSAITSLVRRKLAEKTGDQVAITDAGRAAIGVGEPQTTPINDDPVSPEATASRDIASADISKHAEGESGAALDSSGDPSAVKAAVQNVAHAGADEPRAVRHVVVLGSMEATPPAPPAPAEAADAAAGDPAPPLARPGGKKAQVLALLTRKGGATLDDLTHATGWLPHTMRAALSGLRKIGYGITSEKTDGIRAWRIVS